MRPAHARSQTGDPTGPTPPGPYGPLVARAVAGPPPGPPGTPPAGTRATPGSPGGGPPPRPPNGDGGPGGAHAVGPYGGGPDGGRGPDATTDRDHGDDDPDRPADSGERRHAATDDRRRRRKRPRSLVRTILEWVAVIGGGVLIALVVETFLIQAFWIPSPSMVPTLGVGDRVLVNKLSYRLHDVHRGDVIVFERPPEIAADDGINDLIKRVIAVGGDVIEGRNGDVYVNGEQVDESGYLEAGTPTERLDRQEIPEGEVFVMGDNRTNSEDSRVFGPIAEDTIVGRAFIRVLPLGDIGWL